MPLFIGGETGRCALAAVCLNSLLLKLLMAAKNEFWVCSPTVGESGPTALSFDPVSVDNAANEALKGDALGSSVESGSSDYNDVCEPRLLLRLLNPESPIGARSPSPSPSPSPSLFPVVS